MELTLIRIENRVRGSAGLEERYELVVKREEDKSICNEILTMCIIGLFKINFDGYETFLSIFFNEGF